MPASRKVRWAAALIALCAAFGVSVGFSGVYARIGSAPGAAWIMVAYFTNLTGLLVAVVLAGLALGRPAFADSRLVAGTALATLLVGLIQRLLLQGPRTLRGADFAADILLHQVVPVLVPLFWLAFLPKGRLGWRDPLLWACYPLAYLVVALVRGGAEGRYPYPFLDVGRIGWGAVLAWAGGIAAAFLIVGWGIVALDRALSRREAA